MMKFPPFYDELAVFTQEQYEFIRDRMSHNREKLMNIVTINTEPSNLHIFANNEQAPPVAHDPELDELENETEEESEGDEEDEAEDDEDEDEDEEEESE